MVLDKTISRSCPSQAHHFRSMAELIYFHPVCIKRQFVQLNF